MNDINEQIIEAYSNLNQDVIKAISSEVPAIMEAIERIRVKVGDQMFLFTPAGVDPEDFEPDSNPNEVQDIQASVIGAYVVGFLAMQADEAQSVAPILPQMFCNGANDGVVFKQHREIPRH